MRAILLALVLAAAGCDAEDTTFTAPDERFVAAVVDLREAALLAGTDTARFEELRIEALARHGVTEEELRQYVATKGADLDHMAMIWDSVAARLEEPVQ